MASQAKQATGFRTQRSSVRPQNCTETARRILGFTALDPLRVINLPTYILRGAIERGQILTLHPDGDTQGHPLGEAFNTLATCLNSAELAVVVNLPQEELPGLPMRTHSNFALSVPSPTPNSISLGTLQDSLGHNLETITLTSEELNRHCFVTGLTGYGKTNTCMQILLEAYDKLKVPFLVLEPAKTEYRRLGPALRKEACSRKVDKCGTVTLSAEFLGC